MVATATRIETGGRARSAGARERSYEISVLAPLPCGLLHETQRPAVLDVHFLFARVILLDIRIYCFLQICQCPNCQLENVHHPSSKYHLSVYYSGIFPLGDVCLFCHRLWIEYNEAFWVFLVNVDTCLFSLIHSGNSMHLPALVGSYLS